MSKEKFDSLPGVITVVEAVQLWQRGKRAIAQAAVGQKGIRPILEEGVEARKSVKTWLVTLAGMERVYGPIVNRDEDLLKRCNMMGSLVEVMTTTEAANKWGLTSDWNVKICCRGQKGYAPRFLENEYRKAGGVWLVTCAGMERVFGPRKKE